MFHPCPLSSPALPRHSEDYETSAMVARSQPRKNTDKSTSKCTHCHKKGHTKDQCFELVGYPDWWEYNRDPRQKNSKSTSAQIATTSDVGDCKNSFMVAKEGAPIVDICWPPSHPKAVYSSLTVSGEDLEKLNPFLESGKVKAMIDPTGPYNFSDVVQAFRYLETGRAGGKVVISGFPSSLNNKASKWLHSTPCSSRNSFPN